MSRQTPKIIDKILWERENKRNFYKKKKKKKKKKKNFKKKKKKKKRITITKDIILKLIGSLKK